MVRPFLAAIAHPGVHERHEQVHRQHEVPARACQEEKLVERGEERALPVHKLIIHLDLVLALPYKAKDKAAGRHQAAARVPGHEVRGRVLRLDVRHEKKGEDDKQVDDDAEETHEQVQLRALGDSERLVGVSHDLMWVWVGGQGIQQNVLKRRSGYICVTCVGSTTWR